MTVIEFMGPPGAGKSTISREFARRAGEEAGVEEALSVELTGYRHPEGPPMARWEVAADRALGLVHSPRLTAHAASYLVEHGTGLGMSWMVNLTRRNRTAHKLRRRRGLVSLEEGPLNALCFAAAEREPAWDPRRIVPLLALPDIVVSLSADVAVLVERVIRRGASLSGCTAEEITDLLDRYAIARGLVEDALPTPILRYSTDDADFVQITDQVFDDVIRLGS